MAYRANDPLVMSNVKDIEKRGGFLGMKKENTGAMMTRNVRRYLVDTMLVEEDI